MQATSNPTLPLSLTAAIAYVLEQVNLKTGDTPEGIIAFDQTAVRSVCKLYHVPTDDMECTFATSWVTGFRAFCAGRGLVPATIEGWKGFEIDADTSRVIVREALSQYLDMPIFGHHAGIDAIKVEVEKALADYPEELRTRPDDAFDIVDYAIADVLAFLAGRREGPGYHPCKQGDPSLFGMGPLQATYDPETNQWNRNPDAKGEWRLHKGPPDISDFMGQLSDLPEELQALGGLAALSGVLDTPPESDERVANAIRFLALVTPTKDLREVIENRGAQWGKDQKALALAILDEIDASVVVASSGTEPVEQEHAAECGADTGAQEGLDDPDACEADDGDTDIDDMSTSDQELDS